MVMQRMEGRSDKEKGTFCLTVNFVIKQGFIQRGNSHVIS